TSYLLTHKVEAGQAHRAGGRHVWLTSLVTGAHPSCAVAAGGEAVRPSCSFRGQPQTHVVRTWVRQAEGKGNNTGSGGASRRLRTVASHVPLGRVLRSSG